MDYPKELGMRIKRRRQALGYTQKDVIDELSKLIKEDKKLISEKQLSRIECGSSGTTLENFCLIFKVLNKTPNYFMLGISDETIYDNENLIKDINDCLKICTIDDLDRILLIAKTFSEHNKDFN